MALVRPQHRALAAGGLAAAAAGAGRLFANTARGIEAWHRFRDVVNTGRIVNGRIVPSSFINGETYPGRPVWEMKAKRKASENNRVAGKKQRTWDNRGRGSLGMRMKRYAKACLPVKHFNQFAPLISMKGGGTLYTINLLSGIPLGSTYSSREGDVIDLLSIKLKLRLDNGASVNTANTKALRLAVIKHQQEYDNGATPGIAGGWQTGANGFKGMGFADLFMDNTSYNDLGIFDPKRVTLVWETRKMLKPNVFWNGLAASGAGSETYVERTIKINQKFVYQSGTKWGKTVNWYIIAMVYDYGSTSLQNAGEVEADFDVLFKDAC